MFSLLARLFISDYKNYSKPEVRRSYGTLCSTLAIVLNLLLVAVKLVIARFSGSFSIRADAINNLTDAGSSLLILLAFYFAGMRPRPDRPFGHGRIEYIVGLGIAVLIILCGFEMGRDSIEIIRHPQALSFSWLIFSVLAISIGVKFYMGYFMVSTARKIESEALRATGMESLADTVSTFAAITALLIFQFTPGHWNLDGWFGLFVSLLVLKAGLESAKETLWRLLGTTPDPEMVKKIQKICMAHKEVVGIHDLVIHDYGPGRLHISVHCEMPGNQDVYLMHDVSDQIMFELDKAIGCESVVHMDPICVDDERIVQLRETVYNLVKAWNPEVLIHDFRIVDGPTHTNIIFDCVVPLSLEPDANKAEATVKKLVKDHLKNTYAIVKIDRPYV